MNTIKVVHTADLHLTNPDLINDRIHRQLVSDSLSVFYSIIDFCKEYKPDVLLICGDLFSKPDEEETFAKSVFEKFSEIPYTQVVITPGNHDFLSSSSPFRNMQTQENVYIFSDFACLNIKSKNLKIYGAGFNKRFINRSIFESVSEDDTIKICAIHADVTNSESEYNPVSFEEIEKSGYDYVALGHIHAFSGIKSLGNVKYAYAGTPQGQGFDEKNEKGIIWGTVTKDSVDLNFKKMSKRLFLEMFYNIDNSQSPSEVYSEIITFLNKEYGENYQENLYRINLTGEYKDNHTVFINYITENLKNNFFYCEIIDKMKPDISILKDKVNETSVKGIFLKKVIKFLEDSDPKTTEIAKKALYIGLEVLGDEN